MVVVNDRKSTANQFLVRLGSYTSIINAGGEALACATLQDSQSVSVQGAIDLSSDSITALLIEVAPPTPGTLQAIQQVRLLGTISTIYCDSDMLGNIRLNGPGGTSRVKLSPSTVLEGGADQQPLTCQDLSVGDTLDGQGLINIHNPGVIDAQTMTVG
jgi:hypothetical protein